MTIQLLSISILFCLINLPPIILLYTARLIQDEKHLPRNRKAQVQTSLKFYGSPYQPIHHRIGAFQEPANSPEIKQIWARIPDDIDVLITHSPPANILDLTSRGKHAGCAQLLKRINQIKPQLHVFGHIHEAHGCIKQNSTIFVNASICNLRYEPIRPPIIIDLEIKGTK